MQISKPVKFSRRPGTGSQQYIYSKQNSSFELRFDLKFSIIYPTNGLLKLLLKSKFVLVQSSLPLRKAEDLIGLFMTA